MWTCPKCEEQIEDQFDSCWKCAGDAQRPIQNRTRPLEFLEFVAVMLIIMPGVIGFIHRGAGDAEGRRLAAIFRLSVMGLGAVTLIAVKIYQRRTRNREK